MDQRKDGPPVPRGDVVAGRNAVRELLLSGKSVDRVFAARGDGKLGQIVALAKDAGVPFAAAGWANDIPQIETYMRKHCDLYFKTVEELRAYLFD